MRVPCFWRSHFLPPANGSRAVGRDHGADRFPEGLGAARRKLFAVFPPSDTPGISFSTGRLAQDKSHRPCAQSSRFLYTMPAKRSGAVKRCVGPSATSEGRQEGSVREWAGFRLRGMGRIQPSGSTPCVTFRPVVVSLRGPGRSPVLPFACCVGSLRSVGRCGRCSCRCRFRVRRAQSLVCRGCAGCGRMCRLRVSGANSWRIEDVLVVGGVV